MPVPDAEAWAEATGAAPATVTELRELALHALTEALSFRSRGPIRERLARQQREIAALEAAAATIRCYHPVLLPSMAQTAEYMRQVFESTHPGANADFGSAITARLERQQLLFDRSHRFEFVIPEVALRWHFGSQAIQRGALDRVRQVATMENVWLGVLPLSAGAPAWHAHGFNLYDDLVDGDPVVHVGALTTAINISDPEDVDRYRAAFGRLREASLTDAEALDLIARIIADLSN